MVVFWGNFLLFRHNIRRTFRHPSATQRKNLFNCQLGGTFSLLWLRTSVAFSIFFGNRISFPSMDHLHHTSHFLFQVIVITFLPEIELRFNFRRLPGSAIFRLPRIFALTSSFVTVCVFCSLGVCLLRIFDCDSSFPPRIEFRYLFPSF